MVEEDGGNRPSSPFNTPSFRWPFAGIDVLVNSIDAPQVFDAQGAITTSTTRRQTSRAPPQPSLDKSRGQISDAPAQIEALVTVTAAKAAETAGVLASGVELAK